MLGLCMNCAIAVGILRIPDAVDHSENGPLVILGNLRLVEFAGLVAGHARGECDDSAVPFLSGFPLTTPQGTCESAAAFQCGLNRFCRTAESPSRTILSELGGTGQSVLGHLRRKMQVVPALVQRQSLLLREETRGPEFPYKPCLPAFILSPEVEEHVSDQPEEFSFSARTLGASRLPSGSTCC